MVNFIHRIKINTRRVLFLIMLGLMIPASMILLPEGIWGAGAGERDRIRSLNARVLENPADHEARLKLAEAYFGLAGLKDYFLAKSWLWTESNFKKALLSPELPKVSPQVAQICGRQLLAVLDDNPDSVLALVMSGAYHDFHNQKEIAHWYYRRALELRPDSAISLLALADFYLSQWQPAKVLDLLSQKDGSDFALRKGIAWFQSGEYPMALGYLLQADPLPPWLQIARDLNLCKVYLALEDYNRFRNFQPEQFPGLIPGTIFQELEGWSAVLAGDVRAAERIWSEGEKMNPGYYFWQSNRLGWGFLTPPGLVQNMTGLKQNRFLRGAAWIQQGRLDMEKGDPGVCYRDYLAAINADPQSLVGYLAAARMAVREKEYEKALDILNRGMAVNPKFGPVLWLRAEVNEATGRFQEASRDREAVTANISLKPDAPAPLRLVPVRKAKKALDEPLKMIVQGNFQDLAGFWVSGDGKEWDWFPYWGGLMVVPGKQKQRWWVPVGPGLSGEAIYLEDAYPETFTDMEQPRFIENENAVVFQFPVPVKLVFFFNQSASAPNAMGKSYVSMEMKPEHAVPKGLFVPGNQSLDCWYQTGNGVWNKISFSVNIAGNPNRPAPDNWTNQGIKPEISTQTVSPPPKLASVIVMDAVAEGYPVLWSADQAVTSGLWILSNRGIWSEIPITINFFGYFTGVVPKTAVFCRIVRKSKEGGPVGYYSIPELNRRLSQNRPFRLKVNHGSEFVNSRNVLITIEPDHGFPVANPEITENQTNLQFQWSLSNDLKVWSPWCQGILTRSWRLNSAQGEQLVYVRYQTGGPAPVQITAVPVTLDTLPPQVEIFTWQFQKDIRGKIKGMIINFQFSEPVLLKASIPGVEKSLIQSSNDFQEKFSIKLPMMESPVFFELTIGDRAGNETKYYWQADNRGLQRKSATR